MKVSVVACVVVSVIVVEVVAAVVVAMVQYLLGPPGTSWPMGPPS